MCSGIWKNNPKRTSCSPSYTSTLYRQIIGWVSAHLRSPARVCVFSLESHFRDDIAMGMRSQCGCSLKVGRDVMLSGLVSGTLCWIKKPQISLLRHGANRLLAKGGNESMSLLDQGILKFHYCFVNRNVS